MLNNTSQQTFDGGNLLDNTIKTGQGLNTVIKIITLALKQLNNQLDINTINLRDLGIEQDCEGENKLELILTELINRQTSLTDSLALVNKAIGSVNSGTTSYKDEKVKVNATDEAGYLGEKLAFLQPNVASYNTTTKRIEVIGMVPIGTIVYVDKSKAGSFDNSGKGKEGTDCWGWAMANGNNNTQNRFGLFIMGTDDVVNAGKTAGVDSVVVAAANISGFTLPVTGSISGSSISGSTTFYYTPVNGVITQNAYEQNYLFATNLTLDSAADPSGLPKSPITLPLSGTHTHQFAGSVVHTNATPTALSIIPKHVKEIPIQRIF